MLTKYQLEVVRRARELVQRANLMLVEGLPALNSHCWHAGNGLSEALSGLTGATEVGSARSADLDGHPTSNPRSRWTEPRPRLRI